LPAEIEILRSGLEHYRAGRLRDAERLYGEILSRDPQNADALHLLGLLYLDSGQPQAAAGLVSRAIQQRGDVPFFYNTLGNAFRALGKLDAAVLCFRKAFSLEPQFAEALTNLGSALEESGQAPEAVAYHRRATSLQPDSAEIWGNLANALRSAGRSDEARSAYETALRLRPEYAEAWMNLGNLDFDCEEYRKAEQRYRTALKYNPRLAAAQTNLGSALNQTGKLKEAEEWCRKALEAAPGDPTAQCNLASVLVMTGRADPAAKLCLLALASRPEMPEAHTNLGMALARMHRLDEAERHCRKSLQLRPNNAAAHAHLAHVLTVTGRFAESEQCLRRALELHPQDLRLLGAYGDLCAARLDFEGALRWYEQAEKLAPEAGLMRPARAMVWLAMGDFERGWKEYETRWTLSDCPPREFTAPEWNGEPFPGRTVLLYAEQGLGDTIQFVRFAPFVKQLGGRVILACQSALLPLLSDVEGVDRIVSIDSDLPECDYRLPLLSLPRVFCTTESTIPRHVPYIKVPQDAVGLARERLWERCGAPDGRFRVAVVWAGSPAHPDDRNRSMKLEQLDPLLRAPGVQFLSLQQHQAIPVGSPIIPVVEDSDGIATTAAILRQVDLVITVDTMIAHLAGALGVPVWTLHKLAADWRWMARREDSPWYPSMRLFRQNRFGDWADVVERVRTELSQRTLEPRVLRKDSLQDTGARSDTEFSGRNDYSAPGRMTGILSAGKG
jgi:tetratricopeptide (TPR) repeat protein